MEGRTAIGLRVQSGFFEYFALDGKFHSVDWVAWEMDS
jgi:hypothetical protein